MGRRMQMEAFRELLKRDLKERYLGSQLGFVWSFLQQGFMILVIAFVMEFGLRVPRVSDVPFVVWLIPAQALWYFFSETLNSSCSTYLAYSFLVKKMKFSLGLLPLVKVSSSLINHVVFLVIGLAVVIGYGVPARWDWLFLFYYLGGALVLLAGLSELLAVLTVFYRDVIPIVSIFLTFGMWATPIFWDASLLTGDLRFLFLLNPVAYLTEGYRDTILGIGGPFGDLFQTVFFWLVAGLSLFLGRIVFRRLQSHLADVL